MKRSAIVVVAIGLLVALFAGATAYYQQQQAKQAEAFAREKAALLARDHAVTAGDPDARVTLVEFFDPACGTCKAFHPYVKQLVKEHSGKLRLVLRYAPFHDGSGTVVALLDASRQQGKFWQMLDLTYETQSEWMANGIVQPERLLRRMARAGLDVAEAREAMQGQAVQDNVNQDIADVRELGVDRTPTFYVNGKPLLDFGYEQLRSLVEREIQAAY